MRDFSDEYKLSVRGLVETSEALTALKTRIARVKAIRVETTKGPKRPTKTALVNAILAWLDAQSFAEQQRIVAEGVAQVNRWLARDEAAPPDSAIPERIVRKLPDPAADRVDQSAGKPARKPRGIS